MSKDVATLHDTLKASWYKGARAAADFNINLYQGQDELGGSNVNFADLLARGRPTVLNFWAGDCPPCRVEMPALQRVYDLHRDELSFLGLDVGIYSGLGTRQSALALLKELSITYPAGDPPNGSSLANYRVTSFPTTIFFGADGSVFRRWDGAIGEAQMNGIVDDLLAES